MENQKLTPNLAASIEQTYLKTDATASLIENLCREAIEFHFFGVCVRPEWVSLAVKTLQGKSPRVITVVGFPSGLESTQQKIQETQQAIRDGAQEIDMVLNREALQAQDYGKVFADIQAVVHASGGAPVKVILETSLLSADEKIAACAIAQSAGAAFVKTSTGFAPGGGGATLPDVQLLHRIVGKKMGVKASGGIRTRQDALQLIAAGATRLGTSSGAALL